MEAATAAAVPPLVTFDSATITFGCRCDEELHSEALHDPNVQAQFREALITFFASLFSVLMTDDRTRRPEPLVFVVTPGHLCYFRFGRSLDVDSMCRWSLVYTFLDRFVRIPFAVLWDTAFIDTLLHDVQHQVTPRIVQKCMPHNVAILRQTRNVLDETDVITFVFADRVLDPATVSSKVSIPKNNQTPPNMYHTWETGFHVSAYHNLLARCQTSSVQMLLRRIEQNRTQSAKEWSPKYHRNVLTVIQGTGTGKTRLVQECAQSQYVVYVCLRPTKAERGFPLRSPIADTFLDLPLTPHRWQNVDVFNRFFAALCRAITNVARRVPSVVVHDPSQFWKYTARENHLLFCADIEAAYHPRPHPPAPSTGSSDDLQSLPIELQR
eukprot:gene12950-9259_t